MPEKWLCVIAFVISAGLVFVGVLDVATGTPFNQVSMPQDGILIVAGGLICWQAFEVWRKLS